MPQAARRMLFIIVLLPLAAIAAEVSVRDLPTRAGVTQRVLLIQPERPIAAVILLPRGNGLGIEHEVVSRIADWIKSQLPSETGR